MSVYCRYNILAIYFLHLFYFNLFIYFYYYKNGEKRENRKIFFRRRGDELKGENKKKTILPKFYLDCV